jgi:hypothetical protein
MGKKYLKLRSTSESSKDYEGKGTATYPIGDTYAGQFKAGVRHGFGFYTYAASLDTYEGEWENNEKHGIGKQTYVNVGSYYGRFVEGKRHGEGVITYKNGDIYSGKWERGKKHGDGTYIFEETKMKVKGIWANSEIQEGDWIFPNDKVYPKETYFRGKFDKNNPKGEGTWFFKNGNVIKGEFSHIIPENYDEKNSQIKLNWVSFD